MSLLNLNISKNDITVSGLEVFTKVLHTTNLRELDLSFNPFGNAGLLEIANCLSPPIIDKARRQKAPRQLCKIRKLNIAECKFTQAGALKFFKALREYKEIKNLNLDNNQFAGKP